MFPLLRCSLVGFWSSNAIQPVLGGSEWGGRALTRLGVFGAVLGGALDCCKAVGGELNGFGLVFMVLFVSVKSGRIGVRFFSRGNRGLCQNPPMS